MLEQSIFIEALEKENAAERTDFLDRVCASDPALRERIERLLKRHEEADAFLESPAAAVIPASLPILEGPGSVIGPYKLREQIGEGGFGLVFMAEQQHPMRRKVAVKVLKPGMDTRQVIARFEAERQALALMDHPNIARVLEAGESDAGRPYFVMELVRGVPITHYCDHNGLATRKRLELFLAVCQGVQHAHQKGIIHRDLKPTNVLVTLHDGVPVVKIIDFGIAKALGQPLTDKTLWTGFTQLVGTPLYMSPEQAELSGLDIDTRSDIYSLGVLLYELLTGVTPFDETRLREAGFQEICRIIREEEPSKPSTRVSTLGQAAATVSERRQSDPRRLSQLFRGDLDWIVMKALEKDRSRRYETAGALAADVQRYLQDEPVSAGPPSAWYRYRKFARRNRGTLTMAAVVTTALVLVVGSMGWIVRDRAARKAALDGVVSRATDQAETLVRNGKWPEAQVMIERTETLLVAAGGQPGELPAGLQELAKDIAMARRLEEIYSRRDQQERSEEMQTSAFKGGSKNGPAELLGTPLGEAGSVLKQDFFTGREVDAAYTRAFQDYGIDVAVLSGGEAAARIRSRSIWLELARALDFWSSMRRRMAQHERSDWKQLLEIARAADPDPWRNPLRDALLRSDGNALAALAASKEIWKRPPESLHLLGSALNDLGTTEEALRLLRQAQRQYPDDLWLNDALGSLCFSAVKPRQYDESLRFYTAALALRPNNPYITFAVARTLLWKGSLPESIAQFTKAIELDEQYADAWFNRGWAYGSLRQWKHALADFTKVTEISPKYADAWFNRGWVYGNLDQWDQAVTNYAEAIKLDPKAASNWNGRGGAYGRLEKLREALADYSEAIRLDRKNAGFWRNRGVINVRLTQWDKALADFSEALELDPRWIPAWNSRGMCHANLGQQEQALVDFSKAIKLDPKRAAAWTNRGIIYANLKQWHNAVADFSQAIERNPRYVEAWVNRAGAFGEQGQWDKAIGDYSKLIELQPKNAGRYNMLSWLLATHADAKVRDPRRALELAGKAVELAPGEGNYWNTLGAAQYRSGKWKEAIAALDRSMKLRKGGDSVDWFFLAMSHAKLGEKDQARRWYDRATRWMDSHRADNEELRRFRAEAGQIVEREEKKK